MAPGNDNGITYLGRTTYRNRGRLFGIKQTDRLSHVYLIGKTGTGKSTLIETMLRQDIERGDGAALIDPHGDLVARIAASIPERRRDDVIYFNVPDRTQPYGYNPVRRVSAARRSLAASGLLEVLKKTWDARSWGVRMEHVLRNAILALLEQEDATLPDLLRLLVDKSYRRSIVRDLDNAQAKWFWLREYENYSYRYRADAIAPIQNKVGAFLTDPDLYRILVRPEKPIRIRPIMDQRKILLVNLAKGEIGEDSANLLGGLLVTTIGLAAFSRAGTAESERRDFWLYVDEFQNFTTLALATMLSELRKFHVGMVLAHQYLDQLEPDIRSAVIGNAGTLVSFRVGANDAHFVAREFAPRFGPTDLLSLPNHHVYLKLMIEGDPSRAFSAETLAPWRDIQSASAFP